MRLVYFGSGSFGVPTLRHLVDCHDVALVVTQPDRPAGRGRQLSPTPIADVAAELGRPIVKPADVNTPDSIRQIHSINADAYVVIAFGQKLSPALIDETFAINLHASLLPKYRGAAPINWAMLHNESETGVSVITLADRMDAGLILAQRSTPIDARETAGELHDRLALLGPHVIGQTLDEFRADGLRPIEQDERLATRAPKLAKTDGAVRFDQPAALVRARIHGVTPWPGCAVRFDGQPLRLLRVADLEDSPGAGEREPGTILDDLTVQCRPGRLEVLEVQPAGARAMSLADFARGHAIRPGMSFEPL